MTTIAMWSGPRNLSTALMYSFGARADFDVADEPFYAAYLQAGGFKHPMRAEILSAGETDAEQVAHACRQEAPGGQPHYYQKHMAHHILPGFDRSWFEAIDHHVFLIRHPARVLASYDAKYENPTLNDIAFVQQSEIFEEVRGLGHSPVVIDSYDIRQNPEAMLRLLCSEISITFDPAMLSWPAGGHVRDGIWARHWYDAVHRSTGFAGAEGQLPEVADHLRDVHDAAMEHYENLQKNALK